MKFRTLTTIVIETEEEIEGGDDLQMLKSIAKEASGDLIQKAEKVAGKFAKWYANGDERVTTLIDCDVVVGVTEEVIEE